MKNKQAALDRIAKEIEKCRICRRDKIGLPVPGEGNPDADVVFLGEAPGKQEAKTGKPFIGRSGKLLRKTIQSIGLDDVKDVFITSPVKYLPKHGTPTPAEVAHGRTHLFEQLDVIQPKLVVLMGRVACLAVLERNCPVAQEHGAVVEKDARRYFITFHPAAALRFPPARTEFKKDFLKLKRLLTSRAYSSSTSSRPSRGSRPA